MGRRTVLAAVADVVAVALFVVVGRRSHDDGLTASGVVTTAAPFLIALAAGWVGARVWRDPLAVTTGVAVWVITVVVGLVLRRTVFDDGTALAFVIVTAVTLGALLLGWRVVARRLIDDLGAVRGPMGDDRRPERGDVRRGS